MMSGLITAARMSPTSASKSARASSDSREFRTSEPVPARANPNEYAERKEKEPIARVAAWH